MLNPWIPYVPTRLTVKKPSLTFASGQGKTTYCLEECLTNVTDLFLTDMSIQDFVYKL